MKTIAKPYENPKKAIRNYRKTIGNPQENHCKTMAKPEENLRKTTGSNRKTIGKP